MGTRADFYVGRGVDAEWLGSIAWDGYPGGIPSELLHVQDEGAFCRLVRQFLADREDGTTPEMGWPWPWEDSRTTDYAYAFEGDQVWASRFGNHWFPANAGEPDLDPTPMPRTPEGHLDIKAHTDLKPVTFPDMTERQAVTRGSRSGVMVIGVDGDGRVGPIDPKDIDAAETTEGNPT